MGGIVGGDIKKDVSMVSEGASSMTELMIDEERLKKDAEYATRNLVREVLHHVKRYLVGYIYGCYNLVMQRVVPRYGLSINYEVKTSSIPWGFEVTVKVTIPEKARDDLRSSILEKLKGKGSSPNERAVLRLRSYMERLIEV
jgi:hypothetical protein